MERDRLFRGRPARRDFLSGGLLRLGARADPAGNGARYRILAANRQTPQSAAVLSNAGICGSSEGQVQRSVLGAKLLRSPGAGEGVPRLARACKDASPFYGTSTVAGGDLRRASNSLHRSSRIAAAIRPRPVHGHSDERSGTLSAPQGLRRARRRMPARGRIHGRFHQMPPAAAGRPARLFPRPQPHLHRSGGRRCGRHCAARNVPAMRGLRRSPVGPAGRAAPAVQASPLRRKLRGGRTKSAGRDLRSRGWFLHAERCIRY